MFFKRGKGPLVSVLLPTRGKIGSLCEAIDSLYSLAVDKSLVEFCLKIDDDDEETINVINHLAKIIPIKTIISPRGRGYTDFGQWVNDLCAMSTGDWLYIFNDDARMRTIGWDQLLLNSEIMCPRPGAEDVCLFVTPTINRPGAKEFMFLRRTVYEILGHWALGPYVDHWIYSVMSYIYAAYDFIILVEHFVDSGNSSIDYIAAGEAMASNKAIRERLSDANKLMDYIDSAATKSKWNPSEYYKSLVSPGSKKYVLLDDKLCLKEETVL
jgi:hypothetical protein